MKEAVMWKQIKIKFNRLFPHGIIRRIETGQTAIGIPDIYYKTTYDEGWIEMKQLKRDQYQYIWRVPFRPGQYEFLMKHTELNGTCYLVATIDKRWFIFKGGEIRKEYSFELIESMAKSNPSRLLFS